MEISCKMRALLVEGLTADLSGCRLTDVAVPRPGRTGVLVRIEAASISYPDLLQCQGLYQDRPALPFVAGSDVAGIAVAIGPDVSKLRLGDRVSAVRMTGGLAQFGLYEEHDVWPIPENVSFVDAAAAGSAYLTAYVALVVRGQLRQGEWLLVHGAAGGVGLAAVDMGKALGAKVIAATGSAVKLAAIAEAYAPDVLLDSSAGFRDRVKQITKGGADVIFDPVGGDVFDESMRCIAGEGRLLVIGFTGGRIGTVKTNLPLLKNISIVGVRAGETAARYPGRHAEMMQTIWRMVSERVVHPHVDATWPLANWHQGFEALLSRTVIGRTVILPWVEA